MAPAGDSAAANGPYHVVQFYEDERFLLDCVGKFLSDALRSDIGAVVVATEAHLEALERRWRSEGLDLTAARSRGQYVPLEAAQTLAKLLDGGLPDSERFVQGVGSVIAAAGSRYPRVLVFGEMVALLADDAQHAAAARLEELWNDLGRTHSFSLLCAYGMKGFSNHAHAAHFADVCAAHSAVIPAESYTSLTSSAERLRTISSLQQKAQALEREIVERARAERALLEADWRKDDFLATLAHELRNPLAPMRNAAEIMRMADGDREVLTAARTIMERQLDRLVRVIDDMIARLSGVDSVAGDAPAVRRSPRAQEIGSRRILIADDNLDAAQSLEWLLQLDGHVVLTASDGVEALEIAAWFRPDVVLLDLGMPRLDGYETVRRARQQPWSRDSMIVALTGWGQPEDHRRVQEAGFDHHLVKPCDPDALRALLA
jgi:CheY-like chemotaxis protein